MTTIHGLEVLSEDPTQVYELLEMLGRGSYGSVYKGRHKETSRIAAIKIIPLEEDEEGLEDLRKEIAILKDCKHENIVGYMGSYFKDEKLWIAMEYCGGGSVSDLCQITEKPLVESQIALICREVLKGLAYLHKIKKIHRDIKGGNILLTEQGDIKLADFGVSAQLQNTMSKRNTFVGTPYWMAPEVIQESRYDGRADVWSVGITAIEMGEIIPPLANIHPMRVLFMIPRDPPPKLSEPDKWSTVFRDFIAKCLIKDKVQRPTAQELLSHPFVSQGVRSRAILADAVEQCQSIVQERGYGLYEDDDEEGVQTSDGTVNIAGDDSTVVNSTTVVSEDFGTTVQQGEESNSNEVPTFIRRLNEAPLGTSTAKKDNNFGLDDSLRRLYDRSGIIATPWLNLSHMTPSAMLAQHVDLDETLRDICPEAEDVIKGGPLQVSPQLGNLLRVLAYYKHREAVTPVSAKELETNRKIVADLTKTLKTILKL